MFIFIQEYLLASHSGRLEVYEVTKIKKRVQYSIKNALFERKSGHFAVKIGSTPSYAADYLFDNKF